MRKQSLPHPGSSEESRPSVLLTTRQADRYPAHPVLPWATKQESGSAPLPRGWPAVPQPPAVARARGRSPRSLLPRRGHLGPGARTRTGKGLRRPGTSPSRWGWGGGGGAGREGAPSLGRGGAEPGPRGRARCSAGRGRARTSTGGGGAGGGPGPPLLPPHPAHSGPGISDPGARAPRPRRHTFLGAAAAAAP